VTEKPGFVESGHNAVIMGPVGVGKAFLVTALGHAAIRRRFTVHFERCVRLLKRLLASRLDNSHDAEMRRLLRVDLLIVDDLALQALDAVDTADVYDYAEHATMPRRDWPPSSAGVTDHRLSA
jgi:DNA replication protein DnaC